MARAATRCDACAVTAATIALLGRVSIDQDGRPAGRGVHGRRAELVFAYLAAEHDRAVSRDALADALWPHALPDTWAAALRGVVSEVRRFLEDAGLDPAAVLVSANGSYELRLPPCVGLALDEARAAFRSARELLAGDAPAEAAVQAERAATLAGRPFLPQHEGEWVDGVRDGLATLRVHALELQARASARAGDRDGAADAADRLVRAEPYCEAAHQLRIRLLGELGDRAGAAAAFEHCRAVLAAELGSRPSAETEAVMRAALARAPAIPRGERDGIAPLSVLVVEGHEFQRRTAVALLRGLGVGAIAEAADGTEALEVIVRTAPDVIVCDLASPGMDAVQLIRHLADRQLASGLIVMTRHGHGRPERARVARGGLRRPAARLDREAGHGPAARRADRRPRAWRGRGGAGGARHDGGRRYRGGAGRGAAGRALPADRRPRDGHGGRRHRGPGLGGRGRRLDGRGAAPGRAGRRGRARGPAGRARARAGVRASRRARWRRGGVSRSPSRSRPVRWRTSRWPTASRRSRRSTGRSRARSSATSATGRSGPTRASSPRSRACGSRASASSWSGSAPGPSPSSSSRTPLTGLKVDAGLVTGAAGRPERAAAVEQALELARAVRLPAAAAGCDGPGDFDLLLQLGCRFAEGAFIAAPMAGDDVVAWAAGRRPPSVAGGVA